MTIARNLGNLVVDSFGNVSVGTSTIGYSSANRTSLTVNGTSTSVIGLYSNNTPEGYLYTDGTNLEIAAQSGILYAKTLSANSIIFAPNSVERLRVESGGNTVVTGNCLPATTNTVDLGSAAQRWRNIYTQDLHLSNGIGDWTVVEGEENLYIVNNKSGKSFKFALIEVDPAEVPPKSTG